MALRVLLKPTFLMVLCSHCLSASVRPESGDVVVARVNGERIERKFYEARTQSLEKDLSRQFAGSKLKEELAKEEPEVLKALIDELVLRQKARELGFEAEAELVKHLDQMRRDKGFDDFESLERSLAAKGVDLREFKHDLEQRLVRAHLLRTDTNTHPGTLSTSLVEDSKQEGPIGPRSDLNQNPTRPEELLRDYIVKLRRLSVIEVKHGLVDTGVAYTEDLNQDLLIAARIGDTLKIRVLLDHGANPNTVGANGYSALMHAAELGHKDSVEALLAGGGQPNAKNHSGETPLLLAAIEGYQDIVAVLLANEADPNIQDTDGVTPLIRASTNCDTGIVGSLLKRKIDINSEDKSGRTALIGATVEGCGEVVAALLSRGADSNLMDTHGRSALTYAVESGHKDLVQALLRSGARVDARDNEGKTALIYAVIAGRLDLLAQLLVEQADVNAADNESQTPLMFAAAGGSQQIVQALLDAGANTSVQTFSPYLVRYDAVGLPNDPLDPDRASSSSNLTALDIAQTLGHEEIVEVLKKAQSKDK